MDWPPPEWDAVYARYREHAAWYSGSPNQLAAVYYGGGNHSQGFWRTDFDRFWARSPSPQTRLMLHVPLAAALATVSSDLLFSEAPDFVIPGELDSEGTIQTRLNALVREDSIIRTLAAQAESVAALGGGFLRVIWDSDLHDHPLLRGVDADAAIPEFDWTDGLAAVTFWKVIQRDQKEIWRLLERHEKGRILYGLYQGTDAKLGQRQPLTTMNVGITEEIVETQIKALTAVYVPNVGPNRLFRGEPLGRSDYDGLEAAMDALDEASTSLQRDLRLGRARLIVPYEALESEGKGQGATFDLDKEVWEGAPVTLPNFNPEKWITPSQFAIRATEHLAVIRAKMEEVIVSAGYSNASFGFDEGRYTQVAPTATEIVNRERQSFLTRGKKIAYWRDPLERILEVLLAIDAEHFNQRHPVARPRVEFPDSIHDDEQHMATVVQILRAAEAASTEIRVRMVHPRWSDAEVEAEVKRIAGEGAGPGRATTPDGQTPEAMPPVDGMMTTAPAEGGRRGNFGPNGQE